MYLSEIETLNRRAGTLIRLYSCFSTVKHPEERSTPEIAVNERFAGAVLCNRNINEHGCSNAVKRAAALNTRGCA